MNSQPDQCRWTWEAATDKGRGGWIRHNFHCGQSKEALCELFGLPIDEIERILAGGDFITPERLGSNPALDKIDMDAPPRRVADDLRAPSLTASESGGK